MAPRLLRLTASLLLISSLLAGCAFPTLTPNPSAPPTSSTPTSAAASTTTFTAAPDQQLYQLRAEYPTDRRDAPDFNPCYDIPGPLLQAVGANPDDFTVAHVKGSKDTIGCKWQLFNNPERFLLIEVLPYNEENDEFMAQSGNFTSVRGFHTNRSQKVVVYRSDRMEPMDCGVGYMAQRGRVNLIMRSDGRLVDPYWPCGPAEQTFMNLYSYLPEGDAK